MFSELSKTVSGWVFWSVLPGSRMGTVPHLASRSTVVAVAGVAVTIALCCIHSTSAATAATQFTPFDEAKIRGSLAPAVIRFDPPGCGTECSGGIDKFWGLADENFPGMVHRAACKEPGQLTVCAAFDAAAGKNPVFVAWTGASFTTYTGPPELEVLLAWIRHAAAGELADVVTATTSTKSLAELIVLARRLEGQGQTLGAVAAWKEALVVKPRSSDALVGLGQLELRLAGEDVEASDRGVARLAKALAPQSKPRISADSQQGYELAAMIGFYLSTHHRYEAARKYLRRAVASKFPHDDCWDVFSVANVPHLPPSPEEERATVASYHAKMDTLLAKARSIGLSVDRVGCLGSAFPMAYYDVDMKSALTKWGDLFKLAIPALSLAYTAPHVAGWSPPPTRKRPLRVGFLSSFFSDTASSIWGNFGETIQRLPTADIEVVLIYFPQTGLSITPASKALSRTPANDVYLSDLGNRGENLPQAYQMIAAKRLDVLVYVDLFMSSEMHLLASARLAPVQAYTHGHPVTSGIATIDRFISWAAAELPDLTEAQSHYSEKLALVPADIVWEYYTPRNTDDEHTLMVKGAPSSGVPWGHFTRATAYWILGVPGASALLKRPGARWYFCAQASFKYNVRFDRMLAGIQAADPGAVLILVQMVGQIRHLHPRVRKRLAAHGVDLARVVFVPRMAHPHLMATYKLADVVLDSYFFGGDTTSREAFEIGAPVVTLPHKHIGERWTQAYLRIIGVEELIAVDEDDYVKIAVRTAGLPAAEAKWLRRRIKDAAHQRLFRSAAAAPAWAKLLLDIAGVGEPKKEEL